jgi:hypothetical protein
MIDVRNWSTHKAQYLEGCKKNKVEPNDRVMSANGDRPGLLQQGSLEGWTVTKPPQWSKQGLMEHIIELVVVDDQVREVNFIYVTKADVQLVCDLYT